MPRDHRGDALAIVLKRPGPRVFDLMILIWAVAASLFYGYVEHTRPAGYIGHIMFGALLVVLIYCVLPLPLRLQIVPAAIHTANGIFYYWHAKHVGER